MTDEPKPKIDLLSPDATPAERSAHWNRFFKNKIKPEIVSDFVLDLVEHRKFEDVIACLEQAIRSGQIQPWMYQVLALSMQAVGRPNAQVERVMLSSQDLISNDPNAMMILAAYLVRFDRHDRAIELYRQAAALNPSRPEPYVLALELATRTKNYSAVAWAAPEVLSYSWSKGRERMNQLAEQSAAEAEEAFIKAGDLKRATDLRTAMQQARHLDLVVRLEWSGQGDLDLQVAEPGGSTCSLLQPMTMSGGIFVHDGFGPNQDNCYEEYLCPLAMPGEYRVIIKHVSGTVVGKRARLTIVRDRGSKQEDVITETVMLGPKDQTVRISMSHGRRTKANAEPKNFDPKEGLIPRGHHAALAQLANSGGTAQVGIGPSAVGFTPVVSLINEGIRMGAMATVSGDRRYVRINASPIFSSITDVFTYTIAQ
ncbi:tetratricopeptide repeat protein [Schlesneria paludicola]|uniref:tetratricopeptide repeat protein n=1 Tax=Schlesneria paludicola TaxID=360056 RepID=UPI0002D4DB50|nr:tetratricopeptide repeat protein [Schlesneria paludicola]